MAIGSIVRRAVFGLAVAVAVGGFGATRWVYEQNAVMSSGNPALIEVWSKGAHAPAPGMKPVKPTSEAFGGGWFLMAIGLGVAGAIALPCRGRHRQQPQA